MQNWAELITGYVSLAVEIMAAIVIAAALLWLIFQYFSTLFFKQRKHTNQTIRIHFGSAVAVALELLLAADVLATAIAPTWEDIGKLGAIALIRTFLNFFLEKDIEKLKRNINKGEN